MEVESQRLQNLRYKEKLLSDLNLQSGSIVRPVKRDLHSGRATKKQRLSSENVPTRTSARIASSGFKPSYKEETGERYTIAEKKQPTKQGQKGKELHEQSLRADVEDIRANWTRWEATAKAPPRDEEEGTFHFDDFPSFTPNKSPEEVIREGCFGGSYFRPLKSRKLGIVVEDDWKELPVSWYAGLDVRKYMTSPTYDADVNKFKVACGQSIEEWEANGWIAYEHDIRGWFQWYCRFFAGRRCEDDERQISGWRKCVGETGRWRRMLLKKYLQMGVREAFDDGEDDKEVSPVMHQTCHHWAYQVQQAHLDLAWRSTTK